MAKVSDVLPAVQQWLAERYDGGLIDSDCAELWEFLFKLDPSAAALCDCLEPLLEEQSLIAAAPTGGFVILPSVMQYLRADNGADKPNVRAEKLPDNDDAKKLALECSRRTDGESINDVARRLWGNDTKRADAAKKAVQRSPALRTMRDGGMSARTN